MSRPGAGLAPEVVGAQQEAGRAAMHVYSRLLIADFRRNMLNDGVWPVLHRMRRRPYRAMSIASLSRSTAYAGLIRPAELRRPLWEIGADVEWVERLDPPWRFEPVQDIGRPAPPGWVLEHRYELGTTEWTEGVGQAPVPPPVPRGRPGKSEYVIGAEFAGRAGPNRRIVGAARPDGMLTYIQVDVAGNVMSPSRDTSVESFRKWVKSKL